MNLKKLIISILTLSIFFINILFIQTTCQPVTPTTIKDTTTTVRKTSKEVER